MLPADGARCWCQPKKKMAAAAWKARSRSDRPPWKSGVVVNAALSAPGAVVSDEVQKRCSCEMGFERA